MAYSKGGLEAMGVSTRGPIPKRSDERLGHAHGAQDEVEPDKVPGGRIVTRPEPNPTWHYVAKLAWQSLCESGMTRFYESSDWAAAYLICDQLSMQMGQQYIGMQMIGAGRQEALYGRIPMSGATLSAFMTSFAKLGMTEGDRRRMGIELQRPTGPAEPDEGDAAVGDAMKALGIPQIAGGQRVG